MEKERKKASVLHVEFCLPNRSLTLPNRSLALFRSGNKRQRKAWTTRNSFSGNSSKHFSSQANLRRKGRQFRVGLLATAAGDDRQVIRFLEKLLGQSWPGPLNKWQTLFSFEYLIMFINGTFLPDFHFIPPYDFLAL